MKVSFGVGYLIPHSGFNIFFFIFLQVCRLSDKKWYARKSCRQRPNFPCKFIFVMGLSRTIGFQIFSSFFSFFLLFLSCWPIHTKFRMQVSFGDRHLIQQSCFDFFSFFLLFLSCWLIHTKFRMQVSIGDRYLIPQSIFLHF